MPGQSKSAWNSWRNRSCLSAGSDFLLSTSTARSHSWFINATASAGLTTGGAASAAVDISRKRLVRRERRIIRARPSQGDGDDPNAETERGTRRINADPKPGGNDPFLTSIAW